jgi:hypothetical protein
MSFRLDEKGALLPAAVILLIVISMILMSFLVYFDSKYRTYDSLESHYLRATINEIRK